MLLRGRRERRAVVGSCRSKEGSGNLGLKRCCGKAKTVVAARSLRKEKRDQLDVINLGHRIDRRDEREEQHT